MAGVFDMDAALGAYQADIDAFLDGWAEGNKSARLWQGDASLWTGKDEGRWLGWLNIVSAMQDRADDLMRFAQQVRDDGIRDVLLLGMGGSSLCPEVLAMTFGNKPGWPRLHVLDSTVPEQVLRFKNAVDLRHTLCVVASKSGTTTEPNAFCAYFWAAMKAAVGDDAGAHFVAITDPGSALETLAQTRRFRRVFDGVPEIGGRFSALSNFGLVPAALIGLDLHAFLDRAGAMVSRCGPDVAPRENPGVALGAILGCLARSGRDKLTVMTSPQLWDLGAWLEQLLAESTGKEGHGIVPVDQEPVGAVEGYGDDRAFVFIHLGEGEDESNARMAALKSAGHPVIDIRLDSALALGAEFFRWEVATAVAGVALGIHPFDQPNVQESKDFTARLTRAYESSGRLPEAVPILVDDGIQVFAEGPAGACMGTVDTIEDCLLGYLEELGTGDYVALCAFLDMRDPLVARLQSFRTAIRDRYRVATTLGFGPRFLHSTGQLHKGGGNHAVVLQFTSDNIDDQPIPDRGFSFGILKDAQAIGDAQALVSRERRLVRIHFQTDLEAGIDRLIHALA